MDFQNYSNLPHPTAFAGRTKLHEYYKGSLSKGQIENALASHNTYTQMRQAKKPRQWNPSYSHDYGDHVEIDLLQINTLKRANNGISFYFICIDAFSRYAWSRPLRHKTASECKKAFASILDEMPFRTQRVVSDDGAEFRGVFADFLREKGIEKTLARRHAAYAERLIGTLKGILSKAMHERQTIVHHDLFDDVVDSYNRRRHRIIRMRPIDALNPDSTDLIRFNHMIHWRKREENFRTRTPKLRIGDLVRPQRKRHTWSRSFHQVFETELYRVRAIYNHLPVVMYGIETLDGTPIRQRKYMAELQRVDALDGMRIQHVYWNKRRKHPETGEDSVLVKYAELPAAYNEYMPVAQLAGRRRAGRRSWN